ncbi:MAG: hypothetical protein DWQ47_01885 [Acidobacteria bacterium]|nr:MAG: hypothetical protein DWQ32_05435 [Acidobacteriota bacterium]REK01174.1 MAG: hypothetical protein DWQ38_01870 [Acidobacteriota bacterium]REK14130.1 MAG: hypothetical protein DWQ43_11125 [Acidobacteriota bacterium]REK44845.1 MAG: hypothetical protein DWQ47_01885 [Acidobacteriota bacterium]
MPFSGDSALNKSVRGVLLVGGVLSFTIAFWSDVFRNAENDLTGLIAIPFAFGAAFILNGIFLTTRWRSACVWLSLLLVSQAASFQLINAGWQLRYQHYKPFAEIISGLSPAILALIILQWVMVGVGVFRHLKELGRRLFSKMPVWKLILLLAFIWLTSATVSEDVGFYLYEVVIASAIVSVNILNLLIAYVTAPGLRDHQADAITRFIGDPADESVSPARPDKAVYCLAVFVLLLSSILNVVSYERHPHVPDEVAYLIHSRFLANGTLTMPEPPVPEAFEVYLMHFKDGVWYPSPPPGWPLVLAAGTFFGVPWIVNPLLAALNLILGYIFLREIYPRFVARLSVLLLGLSPWYIFLGMSYMTHMATLTCGLLAALGVCYARRSSSLWALAGGFALGFASLIRPLEAAALAGLLGLWSIGIGGKRIRLWGVAGLLVGSMMVGAIGLAYNAKLTGDPLKFPIMEYTDKYFGPGSNSYGFGPDRGMGWGLDPYPGHGPLDAIVNSNLNITSINIELLGWATGSLLPLFVFLLFCRYRRSDYLMMAVIFVIYALHFFYYYSGGPDFGARYWFLVALPLVALSARGIGRITNAEEVGGKAVLLAVALCIFSVVVFVPWRATDKYHNFRGMRPDIRELAARHEFGRSLVLVRLKNDLFQQPDYESAMIYNPLDLYADVPIYAWDRTNARCESVRKCPGIEDTETRRKLLETYIDRPVWIIESPSMTGAGYRIAAGPLDARKLLEEEKNRIQPGSEK